MSRFNSVQVDAECIKKLLNLEWLGIDNVTQVEEEDAVGPGENYGSVMRRIKLTGEKNGTTVKRSVMMKKDRILSDDIEFPLCRLEIEVYTKILAKFKELIDELPKDKVPIDVMWPICLGVRNYDVILMEDLTETGYAIRNRRVPMPPEVAIPCAGSLGRLHALSLVGMRRNLIDLSNIPPNKYAGNWVVLNNLLGGGLLTLADCVESDQQWKSIAPKLRQLGDTVGLELQSMAEKVKNIFPVICHGDCWSNNIMFKFDKDSNKPTSIKFVDFQVTHYSCFGWDLVYLMNTSMSAQAKQSCYKQLIETYRENLIHTLETFQEDTKQVPSLEEMYSALDKLRMFAMVASFSLFPLTVKNMDKPWDFEQIITTDKVNVHFPELYANKVFQDSFKLDVVRFKSQGLL